MCITVYVRTAAYARVYAKNGLSSKSPLAMGTLDDARWGFHGASSDGITVDPDGVRVYKQILMTLYGANAEWIRTNSSLFETTRVTYKTSQQLVDEKSGIVFESELLK